LIINDTHRFAFLHIPKNGGTSVRQALAPYDSSGGEFHGLRTVPGQGKLDMAHLAPQTIRDHFPAEYEKLARYWTFAVVRDPNERFVSSLYYRLMQVRRRSRAEISTMRPSRMLHEAELAIELVSVQGDQYEPAVVHFAPQSTYVALGTQRLVDELIPLDCLSRALPAIMAARFNLHLQIDRHNVATRPSAGLRGRFLDQMAAHLRRTPLRRSMAQLSFRYHQPGNPLAAVVLGHPPVADFIARHYRADFELYSDARRAWADL
jgi:hypothetical protein